MNAIDRKVELVVDILSVSDQVDPLIYSLQLKDRFPDADLVISCGDLSYLYLEFIITLLDKPLYFVHGNHDPLQEINEGEPRSQPLGGINLHRRIVRDQDLLLAGVEGSVLYNDQNPYQYRQGMMWRHVLRLVPGMLFNKAIYGRYLDIFVTHASPRGIHEGEDWTHQGIRAFRWLIDVFQPVVHFHGHIHVYRPGERIITRTGKTTVINTFRHQVTQLRWNDNGGWELSGEKNGPAID